MCRDCLSDSTCCFETYCHQCQANFGECEACGDRKCIRCIKVCCDPEVAARRYIPNSGYGRKNIRSARIIELLAHVDPRIRKHEGLVELIGRLLLYCLVFATLSVALNSIFRVQYWER
jgi:hypothetical protein